MTTRLQTDYYSENAGRLAQVIEEAGKAQPAYAPYLTLYGKLLREVDDSHASLPDSPKDAEARMRERLDRGAPLLRLEEVARQAGTTVPFVLPRLLAVCAESGESSAITLLDRLKQGALSFSTVQGLLSEEAVDALPVTDQEKTLLLYLIPLMLRPFYQQMAEPFREQIHAREVEGNCCPVCGSKPALSLLLDDSQRRRLYCDLCRTEWSYARIRCVHCGTDEPEALGVLQVPGEEHCRLDVCYHCRGYVKTILIEKMPRPIYLPLESAATLHLDFVAEREGFLANLQ